MNRSPKEGKKSVDQQIAEKKAAALQEMKNLEIVTRDGAVGIKTKTVFPNINGFHIEAVTIPKLGERVALITYSYNGAQGFQALALDLLSGRFSKKDVEASGMHKDGFIAEHIVSAGLTISLWAELLEEELIKD